MRKGTTLGKASGYCAHTKLCTSADLFLLCSPNTPLQPTFSHHRPLSPKPFFRVQHDPLSKILDAVPYQNRLVNGVQSLTVLEQKFHALRIPELDLPTISDTIIRARLDDLYKIQDELYIHLHGGPLVRNTHSIGEKKRRKIMNLLDEIAKEIGLYEEFVKRGTLSGNNWS